MNWAGDYIQEHIDVSDTVLDLGCGVMQSTLDVVDSYPDTKLECSRLVGVDVYKPYLDYLNVVGIETVLWDLTKLPLPFDDKSFDHVILFDVLEHMPTFEDADRLITEAFRIARKKVFFVTPTKFFENVLAFPNPYPYDIFEDNEYQRHHIVLNGDYLNKRGFKVHLKGKHFYGHRELVNKILHVWNQAGVSTVMSKYQCKLGYDAKVYHHQGRDVFHYADVYPEFMLSKKEITAIGITKKKGNVVKNLGIYKAIREKIAQFEIRYSYNLKKHVEKFKPDIIHFHSIKYTPIYFKLLGYKVMIEFHGSSLRSTYNDGTKNTYRKTPNWIFRIYQLLRIPIFVSTPDLVEEIPNYNRPRNMSKLISNPVDIDLFNKNMHEPIKGKSLALFTMNSWDSVNLEKAKLRAERNGFKFIVLERTETEYMDHLMFVGYLSTFECYIDRIRISSLSKTALESLSMGLKVINWKGDLVEGLPSEHDPFNVAKLTLSIYDKIMVNMFE